MRASRTLIAVTCALLLGGGMASAQRLPVALPSLPARDALPGLSRDPLIGSLSRSTLDALRRTQIDRLLRRDRARVDVDPRGEPVLRGEYLALAPDEAMLAAIRAAGFDVVRDADDTQSLGLDIAVLRDRRAREASDAMRALKAAAPSGEFAFQHLYLQAGSATGVTTATATASHARVGLIDGGVGTGIPTLASVDVRRFGCDGRIVPDAHAAAVATRLAGGTRDTLYAADLWCGDRVGQATLGLVRALAWMARENVAVINVSLVGPDNPVLARAIAALVARGHVVVAAVGNDGPAAPPLYPASYPGVVGVGGVDARLHVLPESASGPQVDFSASGIVDARTRGTSFASPVVARLAADVIDAPRRDAIPRVEAALAAHARDLGAPGRDARYGEGYVGGF